MKIFFLFVLTNRARKSLVFLLFGLGPLLQSWKTQRHPTIESTKVYPHNENGSSSSLCSWRDSRASDKWGRTCHLPRPARKFARGEAARIYLDCSPNSSLPRRSRSLLRHQNRSTQHKSCRQRRLELIKVGEIV